MFVKELDVVHCDLGLNRFSNGTSCTDYWEAMTVEKLVMPCICPPQGVLEML